MALISCPECGKEISNQCDKCIHCGYPLHTNSIEQYNTIVGKTEEIKATNSTIYPFFSNKDKADKMQILTFCIAIPLLILGLVLKGSLSYIMLGFEVIICICMIPTTSYIEVFFDHINGRTRSGKKFTVKINEISNAALGGEQITLYASAVNYSVNCGTYGDKIVAFINSSKQ